MSAEGTDFLYPFIDAEERGSDALLADLARSADAKWRESEELAVVTLREADSVIQAAAGAIADSVGSGGKLFVFGNGGSATDADALAHLFASPPSGRSLPARSLSADAAIVTALSNDVGFDLVFSRQLIAYGSAGDVALGLSTSGNSEDLLVAFAEAKRRGMSTIGLSGYDGGRMAASADVDHCVVVRSESVHRIQEVQAAVFVALWTAVQGRIDEDWAR